MSTITESNPRIITPELGEKLIKLYVKNSFVTDKGRTSTGAIDPRAETLSTASSLYFSPSTMPFMRQHLNERQFPMTAEQVKEARARAAARRKLYGDASGRVVKCPVCLVPLPPRIDYDKQVYPARFKGDGIPVAGPRRPEMRSFKSDGGCSRHGVPAPDTAGDFDPSRPERFNVVWSEWCADYTRQIVVVRWTDKGKHPKQTTTGLDEHGEVTCWESTPKHITTDQFFVVMVEEQYLQFGSAAERDAANQAYFIRGVPIAPYAKGWKILEPIEEYIGPFSSCDDAEDKARSWKGDINDDLRDNRRPCEGDDHLRPVS